MDITEPGNSRHEIVSGGQGPNRYNFEFFVFQIFFPYNLKNNFVRLYWPTISLPSNELGDTLEGSNSSNSYIHRCSVEEAMCGAGLRDGRRCRRRAHGVKVLQLFADVSPAAGPRNVQTVLPRSARTVHILDVKSVFAERFEAHVQVTFSLFKGFDFELNR